VWELLQELKSLDGVRWWSKNEPGVMHRAAPNGYYRGDPQCPAYPILDDQLAKPHAEHIWNDTSSDPSHPLYDNPAVANYLEQLLADTAEFDTGAAVNGWGDTSGMANRALGADELMSLWMAAPTDLT
jgi:hypothetical protein